MSILKIKRENGKIFCPLADSWHIETPEEKVRQPLTKKKQNTLTLTKIIFPRS